METYPKGTKFLVYRERPKSLQDFIIGYIEIPLDLVKHVHNPLTTSPNSSIVNEANITGTDHIELSFEDYCDRFTIPSDIKILYSKSKVKVYQHREKRYLVFIDFFNKIKGYDLNESPEVYKNFFRELREVGVSSTIIDEYLV